MRATHHEEAIIPAIARVSLRWAPYLCSSGPDGFPLPRALLLLRNPSFLWLYVQRADPNLPGKLPCRGTVGLACLLLPSVLHLGLQPPRPPGLRLRPPRPPGLGLQPLHLPGLRLHLLCSPGPGLQPPCPSGLGLHPLHPPGLGLSPLCPPALGLQPHVP